MFLFVFFRLKIVKSLQLGLHISDEVAKLWIGKLLETLRLEKYIFVSRLKIVTLRLSRIMNDGNYKGLIVRLFN